MMILDRLTNVIHPLDFCVCLEFCQESANLRENGTKRSFLISPSDCSMIQPFLIISTNQHFDDVAKSAEIFILEDKKKVN